MQCGRGFDSRHLHQKYEGIDFGNQAVCKTVKAGSTPVTFSIYFVIKLIKVRIWCNGNMSAFQAVVTGSNPVIRSTYYFATKCNKGGVAKWY